MVLMGIIKDASYTSTKVLLNSLNDDNFVNSLGIRPVNLFLEVSTYTSQKLNK